MGLRIGQIAGQIVAQACANLLQPGHANDLRAMEQCFGLRVSHTRAKGDFDGMGFGF